MPIISNFKTIKTHKFHKKTNNYTLRIKQKLGSFNEFSDLVENSMYDTHRGVYLPLTIHFIFSTQSSQFLNESYFRMLKFPINFYRRKSRPAFDDAIGF